MRHWLTPVANRKIFNHIIYSIKYRVDKFFSAKFATSVVDTGGKFANGINDTTGVVDKGGVDLRLSPRIFKKFQNDPNVIIGGLEEDNS